ncbi:histidine kinase [Flavobacteriaceae bacterium S356]|uniref:Histidine kinase n=1 Tax=Asprobacillus argus TaxID=3076534 RepID=A0ABU3LEZ3_9FLAO|nr:histidine kinase [Flavobacteriaceae bacterium S356]
MKKSIQVVHPILIGMLHGLFWIVVYFFYTYFLGYGSVDTTYVNRFSYFLMPITMVVSYFFIYHLIPKYLLRKKRFLFVLYSIYTMIIATFLIVLSILYGLVLLFEIRPENSTPLTKTLPFIVLGVYFIISMAVAISLVLHNYRFAVDNEDLENKFLHTQLQLKEQELKFLKMQIHPHFLFNSLNTIYGFALKKSEEAPEMILKLSNLLDYILYQIDKPYVLLEDELLHLEDYISLEKMRFRDTLEVHFDHTLLQSNYRIAPMLLIPFVENAFKHGAMIDGVLKVEINGYERDGRLTFEVVNSSKRNETIKGIGLDNIRRRLEMLYKNAYDLEIEEEESYFKTSLSIILNALKEK